MAHIGASSISMQCFATSRINRRGFKSSLLSTARGFGKRSGGAAPVSIGDHELR